MAENQYKKFAKAIFLRLALYTVLLITLPLAMGYIFMEKLLLPEVKTSERAGNMSLRSGDADLDVFFHPPQPGKPVILYSHGNAETLQNTIDLQKGFTRRGYGFLAYDYAGYGSSGGNASEKQVYRDAESVYKFLTTEKSVAPQDIVLMGFSAGSGAACYLAEQHPEIQAAVLIAPFASAIEVMLPFPLPGNRFNNAQRLRNTRLPLLIIHGTDDRVIPIRNSRKLYATAASSVKKLLIVENAGHNDIFEFMNEKFYSKVEAFLQQ